MERRYCDGAGGCTTLEDAVIDRRESPEVACGKPIVAQLLSNANLRLTECVCQAQEILTVINGGKHDDPPHVDASCLLEDSMMIEGKANLLGKLLTEIRCSLAG